MNVRPNHARTEVLVKMVSTAIHVNVWLDLMERTARTVSIFILRVSCGVCLNLR